MKGSVLNIVFLFLFLIIFKSKAQEGDSRISLGSSFGFGSEIKNSDYSYENKYVKVQLYYVLKKTKNFQFELLLEPEINFANHQLLNFNFITPDQPNFEERRARFTQLKDIREYVLHIGFLVRKPVSQKFSVYGLVSFGPMFTSTETERLSKGFAFSDVLAVGITYKIKHIYLDFRPNFRHNSNAGLQESNAGINTFNYELGIIFPL